MAIDAGSHLAAITRILEKDFPLNSGPDQAASLHANHGNGDNNHQSPGTTGVSTSEDEDSDEVEYSSGTSSPTITTLRTGPFAGLSFPHACARANALHIVREHISTYLITHPHLDHVSGFVINTAAFHNTSRPKRLAALPFTVNAIKTHLFNNIIWPNLTDEDGGVGLVTFQRLAEGGNIALGEGHGRGYIEVCDGLGVKGFKVSHGHCMRGPGHVHRGSNANLPEPATTPGLPHAQTHSHHHHHSSVGMGITPVPGDGLEGRSLSFSLPSQPGTPLFSSSNTDAQRMAVAPHDQCVIDSTAYFIRAESPTSSHASAAREILIFGDVEPDSVSLSPRTALVWAEAAPKIAAGILAGVFIECSYDNSQGDAVLYGHLAPRHLVTELQTLAEMVREARRELEREREEGRKGRKRKRASNGFFGIGEGGGGGGGGSGIEERRRASRGRVFSAGVAMERVGSQDDAPMADWAASPRMTATAMGMATPTAGYSVLPDPLGLGSGVEHVKVGLAGPGAEPPLKGLKVVVMHVKDTLADGPLVGENILRDLEEHERALAEQGKGLGCVFDVSRSGASYWF